MKKWFIIKTVDGNRYETDDPPIGMNKSSVTWLRFKVNDGVGYVYVNPENVVCVIVKEVEDD